MACFGLYGLVSFMTEARTKEIGIGRVLGATFSGITVLLSKEALGDGIILRLAFSADHTS